MKKKIQIFVNIFFFTLLFLIIINLLIKYSWKFYNNYKISKKNPFPEIVRSNFELDDIEQRKLFKETHQMKYYYQPFVGPLPDNYKGTYVNFNKKTGRVISAIIPMHTFGHLVEIDDLIDIAQEYNLELIEDAAESLGSTFKGRHAGTFGKLGVISFN